jgi:hypothetical protein
MKMKGMLKTLIVFMALSILGCRVPSGTTATYTHIEKRLGGSGSDYGNSVFVDAGRNIYIAGCVIGASDLSGDGDTLDSGESAPAPYGNLDVFVSKFDPQGIHLWSKRLGGASIDQKAIMAVDSTGIVVVTGTITSDADLNGDGDTTDPAETAVAPYGSDDIFISRFDSSGNHLSSVRLGGSDTDSVSSMAIDRDNNIILAGSIWGNSDLSGNGTIDAGLPETATAQYGGFDAFIVKFTSAGVFSWGKRLGSTGADFGNSVAVNSSGTCAITGYLDGTGDLNGDGDATDSREISAAPYGTYDIYLSTFDKDGVHGLSIRLGGTGFDSGESIAYDNGGNIILIGSVQGTADLNNDGDTVDSNETAVLPYAGLDLFISKVSDGGTCLWVKRIGGTGPDSGLAVITDTARSVIVTGHIDEDADLNGDGDTADSMEISAAPYGSADVCLIKFDENGVHQWSNRLGGSGSDDGLALGLDSINSIIVTGYVNGSADLNGNGVIDTGMVETTAAPYGGDDVFLFNMKPDGTF